MAKDFEIARTAGVCVHCDRQLAEQEEFETTLVCDGAQLVRQDWCLTCWEAADHEQPVGLFGQWRTRMPVKQAKKKLFVDDAMLANFFLRLEGDELEGRREFRFVLALVLMRKKLLNYEGSTKDDQGEETWTMRFKGETQTHNVLDPRLDEEKIAVVSEQLSEILQGEL